MKKKTNKELFSKNRKLRVFISMPFTGKTFEQLTQERKELSALVESSGFELLEQFIDYQKKPDFESKDYDPSYILAKDKHFIKQSDVVIADLTSFSIGAICEVTIAKELFDKKVYAIVPHDRKNHPWLKFYCDYFVDSISDALAKIKNDFSGKKFIQTVDKQQYDPIAVEYKLVEKTPAQKYIYDPAVASFLKNSKNKTVVVLHAGSGYRSRLAKNFGADKVIGVDLSHKQIQLAREEELIHPKGIQYLALDPYSKDFLSLIPNSLRNSVDIVLGVFLLDHAGTQEELDIVIKNVFGLLKKNGQFFGMLDHSQSKVQSDSKYGVGLRLEENSQKIKDGILRRVSIYQNGLEVLHFHNFAWKTETIRKFLEKNKFSQISLKPAFVSADGLKKYGKEYWKNYYQSPDQIIFSAKK